MLLKLLFEEVKIEMKTIFLGHQMIFNNTEILYGVGKDDIPLQREVTPSVYPYTLSRNFQSTASVWKKRFAYPLLVRMPK